MLITSCAFAHPSYMPLTAVFCEHLSIVVRQFAIVHCFGPLLHAHFVHHVMYAFCACSLSQASHSVIMQDAPCCSQKSLLEGSSYYGMAKHVCILINLPSAVTPVTGESLHCPSVVLLSEPYPGCVVLVHILNPCMFSSTSLLPVSAYIDSQTENTGMNWHMHDCM